MVNAEKAAEAFKDILTTANYCSESRWIQNAYVLGHEGKMYQFCCDGFRMYAIPAVIPDEDWEALPHSKDPTRPVDTVAMKRYFEEYKGEGFKQVKLPTMKDMRDFVSASKRTTTRNEPHKTGDGMWFVKLGEKGEGYSRLVLDMGDGHPKMVLHQLMQALEVIPRAKVYMGKDNYPIHITDGEAHVLITPLNPKYYEKVMRQGRWSETASAL